MTDDQNLTSTGQDDSGEAAAEARAAGSAPDVEPAPRCGALGPDSWTLLPQGGSFCDLPLGHPGRHYESGAPRTWIDDE